MVDPVDLKIQSYCHIPGEHGYMGTRAQSEIKQSHSCIKVIETMITMVLLASVSSIYYPRMMILTELEGVMFSLVLAQCMRAAHASRDPHIPIQFGVDGPSVGKVVPISTV